MLHSILKAELFHLIVNEKSQGYGTAVLKGALIASITPAVGMSGVREKLMKSGKWYISGSAFSDCLMVSRGQGTALVALFWRFKLVFSSPLSLIWNISHLPVLLSDSLAKPLSKLVSQR